MEEYNKFLDRTGEEVGDEVVKCRGGEGEAFEWRIKNSNHLVLARSISLLSRREGR